jgi:pimeloyl-ACP methyl ester carboxylesterase
LVPFPAIHLLPLLDCAIPCVWHCLKIDREAHQMEVLNSRDGTPIAYERSGKGPPLVLVHGSTADHTRWANILPKLNQEFSVLAMDRRGRGGSGDAENYSLEQEYEDVAAVVRAAGSGANLLGHSFGALCAMEAALRVDNLNRLVLYEPPFPIGDAPLYPPELPDYLHSILETGDREKFLVAFFREAAGVPDQQIEALRSDPSWPARIAGAHTALREMAEGDYVFKASRFNALSVPTLLLIGENSPIERTGPAKALDAALPDSQVVVLEGQGHVAMTTAPELFLDAVTSFLAG